MNQCWGIIRKCWSLFIYLSKLRIEPCSKPVRQIDLGHLEAPKFCKILDSVEEVLCSFTGPLDFSRFRDLKGFHETAENWCSFRILSFHALWTAVITVFTNDAKLILKHFTTNRCNVGYNFDWWIVFMVVSVRLYVVEYRMKPSVCFLARNFSKEACRNINPSSTSLRLSWCHCFAVITLLHGQ